MPSNSSDDAVDPPTSDEIVDEQPAKPTGKARKSRPASSSATTVVEEAEVSAGSPDEFSLTVSRAMVKKVGVAVLAVALVALIGIGVWQWVVKSQELDAFSESKAASDAFVTALVSTSNADTAGSYKEILGPLSTGDLRTRLEKERADTEKNVADLKLKVTSKILVSAVEDFTTDTASTLVMAEVTGTSAQLPTGATNLMVFRLNLSKVDGKWLVSKFDGPPGSKNGQIDPSQSLPGASTTTPAPTG